MGCSWEVAPELSRERLGVLCVLWLRQTRLELPALPWTGPRVRNTLPGFWKARSGSGDVSDGPSLSAGPRGVLSLFSAHPPPPRMGKETKYSLSTYAVPDTMVNEACSPALNILRRLQRPTRRIHVQRRLVAMAILMTVHHSQDHHFQMGKLRLRKVARLGKSHREKVSRTELQFRIWLQKLGLFFTKSPPQLSSAVKIRCTGL